MRLSDKAEALIKEFEGISLTAYPDPATGGQPWTIGYGHTGPEVYNGLRISTNDAQDFFIQDVEKIERFLDKQEFRMTENEYGALVSFIYNVGMTNFKISTLYKLLLKGESDGEVAMEFIKWSKVGNKRIPGLIKRRARETVLFLTK